jgi:signal transduction histidine kinase
MKNKIAVFFHSTRFKTTLWYATSFLIFEIVIGITIYFYLKSNLYRQLDLSLSNQVNIIHDLLKESKIDFTDFAPDSVYSSPYETIYDLIFETIASSPRNSFIQVLFKDKVIFQSENLKGHLISVPVVRGSGVRLIDVYDKTLSIQPIRAAILKQDKYKIIVAFPIVQILQTLSHLTDIYLIIAPVFLIFSFLGGAVLSVKSLSRIDSVIEKTNEITTQNLGEILEGGEPNDEYGRLVNTMNKMIHRIKTSIEYMTQFSISASHELKTPLTILRGEIELALKYDKTPAEYKEILQSNYEETLRMINIVEKLFFISKFDNAIIKINKTDISLNGFLENLICQLKYLGKDKKIHLDTHFDKDTIVNLDANLFKQAITNLVDNAIKYGERGKPVIIETELLADDKVRISITNRGDGIQKENLLRIFERFYREESSRNRDTGGSGLGLSVVKSIVDWHDGKILVDSDPGKKTTFSIII